MKIIGAKVVILPKWQHKVPGREIDRTVRTIEELGEHPVLGRYAKLSGDGGRWPLRMLKEVW